MADGSDKDVPIGEHIEHVVTTERDDDIPVLANEMMVHELEQAYARVPEIPCWRVWSKMSVPRIPPDDDFDGEENASTRSLSIECSQRGPLSPIHTDDEPPNLSQQLPLSGTEQGLG